ncbi:MAG: hypothetical protein IKA71_05535 [Lentisphaeria bacterium]|nr:hypothetical protein [Lentisphaeria bacterium]
MADENNTLNQAPMEEDTRTRKTVRLRAIAPEVSAATTAAPAAPAVSAPISDGDDTMTRKTVKLKPVRPAIPVPTAPVAAAPAAPVAAAPAAPVTAAPAAPVEDDTRTRKTVVIRPAVAPAAAAPAGADDRTVKIQRPAPKVIAPKPVVPAAAPQPVAPKPAVPAAAPKPVAPKPVVPAAAPKVVPPIASKTSDGVETGSVPEVAFDSDKKDFASIFCTVAAALALVAILGTALLTTAHYLQFEHDTIIEIPGLSK